MTKKKHLLGIEHLSSQEINKILDLAEDYAWLNGSRSVSKKPMAGMTQINMFLRYMVF